MVKSETVHLLKLINRLLTISKLENDKLTMVKEKVKLEPMLERIRETFKAKSTKPLHFTLNLQAKEVNADKEYLEEAVYNLVDNAVKYSKDEGEVEIEITSECSGVIPASRCATTVSVFLKKINVRYLINLSVVLPSKAPVWARSQGLDWD